MDKNRPHFGGQYPCRFEGGSCVYCGKAGKDQTDFETMRLWHGIVPHMPH